MFPIQEKIKKQEESEPFIIDYVITAKGRRASGGIKCNHPEDKKFWRLLEMIVNDILEGGCNTYISESYVDGFSRYIRPVKRDDFTLKWVELNYNSSEQSVKEENE